MSESHAFVDYFKRAVSPLAVLTLLRKKPMYGYEISQEKNDRGKGKLTVAVLYSVLYRLEQQGYVYISDTKVENGRARSYYALTPEGEAYLDQTVSEYKELSEIFMALFDER